jgi:hypothetical protein
VGVAGSHPAEVVGSPRAEAVAADIRPAEVVGSSLAEGVGQSFRLPLK